MYNTNIIIDKTQKNNSKSKLTIICHGLVKNSALRENILNVSKTELKNFHTIAIRHYLLSTEICFRETLLKEEMPPYTPYIIHKLLPHNVYIIFYLEKGTKETQDINVWITNDFEKNMKNKNLDYFTLELKSKNKPVKLGKLDNFICTNKTIKNFCDKLNSLSTESTYLEYLPQSIYLEDLFQQPL